MPEKIGQRLKMVRKLYGLSQRELAKRAGVANSAISVMEQDSVSPSVASLGKVLTGFPLAVSDFFSIELNSSGVLRASSAAIGADLQFTITAYSTELGGQPQRLLFKHGAIILVVAGSLSLSTLHGEMSLQAGQQFKLPAMTLCLANSNAPSNHWVVGHLST